MLSRFFLFITGFGLMTIGLSTLILYINLFTIGYNFKEYISCTIKLPQTYYLLIGFILINISTIKREKKNEKYM